jgi:D-alanyl-D-alanine dipeptidase
MWGEEMKKQLCLWGLCVILLTGCTNPFADFITDEEYYQTHTGTTEESVFAKKENDTVQEEETSDDEVDITECDLRTGVEAKGYAEASDSKEVATIPADEVLRILAEETGYFKVSYEDEEMWVLESQCLVNAKQYIPSLIVNLGMGNNPNYFNIGDTQIPGVTDQLFYTRSGSQDGSEAWMRYDVAKQLKRAQNIFLKDGYCIKIYDAYRPYSVTIAIRDGYSAYLKTDEGKKLKQKYYFGGYNEGSFLAQRYSAHNYGVAVDMTLVESDNEEEIVMPSPMHTLDARSALKTWEGNGTTESSHAEYMRGIMVSYGFSTLDSEWWHFQIDTISRTLFDVPN